MPAPFALVNATLVLAEGEGALRHDHTVLVDSDGMLERVGSTVHTPLPPTSRRIDLGGSFVVPGLINAHAHVFADGRPLPKVLVNESTATIVTRLGRSRLGLRLFERRARANVLTQLKTGVTTIRTLGDVAYEVVKVAREIDSGACTGPRVLPSGPLFAVPGGHGAPQIAHTSTSPGEAAEGTRASLARGVRAVKISATAGVTDAREVGYAGRPEMPEEQMAAICAEAHRAGIPVAAHAQSTEGIRAALRAGVDTIEHGASLDQEIIELFLDNPRSLRGSSSFVPTLQACLPLFALPQDVTGASDVVRANAEMVWNEMMGGLEAARAHGITIGMGTDSGVTYATHYNTWRELDLLVRYGGLTPAEAVHAGTAANARILGLDGVTGSLEPGRAADLVVLRSNPLLGVRAFENPRLVIARGAVVEDLHVDRFEDLEQHFDTL